MRKNATLLLIALLVTATAHAQESAPKEKTEAEAIMEAYVEAAKPVAEHQRLAELSGPWNVTTSLWFGPEAPEQKSTGSGSGRMILGGRFLQLDTTVRGAMNHEAVTIMGYDRRTGEYTMFGIDTLGTYSITAKGRYDARRQAIVLDGSYAQPPSGNEQKYRFVLTSPSSREHLMTLFFEMDGKDVRVAETRYTRE